MDKNKKVYPVCSSIDYADGSKEIQHYEGESYFERCVREFTASLLTKESMANIRSNNYIPSMVGMAIQTALEVERQLKILNEVKKG
jgi:hypothetical protein